MTEQEAGGAHPAVAPTVAATQVKALWQEIKLGAGGLNSPAFWLASDFCWIPVCPVGERWISTQVALWPSAGPRQTVPGASLGNVCLEEALGWEQASSCLCAMRCHFKIPAAGCWVQGERIVPWFTHMVPVSFCLGVSA